LRGIRDEENLSFIRNITNMKRKNILPLIIISFVSLIIQSCNNDSIPVPSEVAPVFEKNQEVFQPSYEIQVVNGMLSFDSKIAFDVTKLEIASSNRKAVDNWEKGLGIKTPASIFSKVLLAEDSINNHMKNLPKDEQEFYLNQPQIHSKEYNEALEAEIIALVDDGDGGQYFDLNLFDKTVASVINIDGLVIVEGRIFKFTVGGMKIIKDGDFSMVEKISTFDSNTLDNNIIVFELKKKKKKITNETYEEDWSNNWTQTMDWYYFDKNWLGNDQKRIKVWVDGHSEHIGSNYRYYCSQELNCTFSVHAQAQEKNFWGNWVYGSYAARLILNASWEYSYKDFSNDPYIQFGCGLYETTKNYLPAYSCGVNPSYMCPTAPFYYNQTGVNHASINLTPHGAWSSNPKFFADAFMVHGTITWTFGPKGNQVYTW